MHVTNWLTTAPIRLIAPVMARMNRDAELEAVSILDPTAGDTVVAIGFGPGVGVAALACRTRRVVGVDPSQVMVDIAARRSRRSAPDADVTLTVSDAASLPLGDGEADGATAVNSIQLWSPLAASLAEVARVLRPTARLVSLTHDWAIRRSTGLEVAEWAARTSALCAAVGLVEPQMWRAGAERGRSIVFQVEKATESTSDRGNSAVGQWWTA